MADGYFTVSRLNAKQIKQFFSKVEVSKTLSFAGSACWMWTASTRKGYGQYHHQRKPTAAHRYAYAWLVAPLPKGKDRGELDHLCRNTLCVNPVHLEFVSQAENTRRGVSVSAENARKTHCKRGHPLDGDNLYMFNGRRCCKECRRQEKRNRRAATPKPPRRKPGPKPKTHCKRGHRFTDDNIYRTRTGRSCLTCRRLLARDWSRQSRE